MLLFQRRDQNNTLVIQISSFIEWNSCHDRCGIINPLIKGLESLEAAFIIHLIGKAKQSHMPRLCNICQDFIPQQNQWKSKNLQVLFVLHKIKVSQIQIYPDLLCTNALTQEQQKFYNVHTILRYNYCLKAHNHYQFSGGHDKRTYFSINCDFAINEQAHNFNLEL